MKNAPSRLLALFAGLLLAASTLAAKPALFAGSWAIDRDASTVIDPWGRILMEIAVDGDAVTISRTFSTGLRKTSHVYAVKAGETVAVPMPWWTGNRHIGAYMGGDMTESVHAEWLDGGRTLRLDSRYILQTSQGETPVRSHFEFRISADGAELTVIELRSSRNKPSVHVFRRV